MYARTSYVNARTLDCLRKSPINEQRSVFSTRLQKINDPFVRTFALWFINSIDENDSYCEAPMHGSIINVH
jgi:hypothetical protein